MNKDKLDFLDDTWLKISEIKQLIEEQPKNKNHKDIFDNKADNFGYIINWENQVLNDNPNIKKIIREINSDILSMANIDFGKFSTSCLDKIKLFEEEYHQLRKCYL
ncbi:hypothetical protein GQ473_01770 [archaeon]|nr:hypothetical protein [archaeon]